MGADVNVWRALLSACRVQGNVQLGGEVGRTFYWSWSRSMMAITFFCLVYSPSTRDGSMSPIEEDDGELRSEENFRMQLYGSEWCCSCIRN